VLSDFERAETIGALTKAGVPLVSALRRNGWTDAELAQVEEDKKADSEASSMSLGQALLEAQRRRDQNAQPGAQKDAQAGKQDPQTDPGAML
ncbi:hypothetical protein U2057_15325, partial [Listeria monocytogenes]|uniref:hypothetical protein n=1 Tax=Listeria monocytogenes TaxID=1639 RepID=UPI002FDC3F69